MSGRQGSAFPSAARARQASAVFLESIPIGLGGGLDADGTHTDTPCLSLCSAVCSMATLHCAAAHAAAEPEGAVRKTAGAGTGRGRQTWQCDDHSLNEKKAFGGGAGTCGRHIHCALRPAAAPRGKVLLSLCLCACTNAHCSSHFPPLSSCLLAGSTPPALALQIPKISGQKCHSVG